MVKCRRRVELIFFLARGFSTRWCSLTDWHFFYSPALSSLFFVPFADDSSGIKYELWRLLLLLLLTSLYWRLACTVSEGEKMQGVRGARWCRSPVISWEPAPNSTAKDAPCHPPDPSGYGVLLLLFVTLYDSICSTWTGIAVTRTYLLVTLASQCNRLSLSIRHLNRHSSMYSVPYLLCRVRKWLYSYQQSMLSVDAKDLVNWAIWQCISHEKGPFIMDHLNSWIEQFVQLRVAKWSRLQRLDLQLQKSNSGQFVCPWIHWTLWSWPWRGVLILGESEVILGFQTCGPFQVFVGFYFFDPAQLGSCFDEGQESAKY